MVAHHGLTNMVWPTPPAPNQSDLTKSQRVRSVTRPLEPMPFPLTEALVRSLLAVEREGALRNFG